jgi:hypothetical protein
LKSYKLPQIRRILINYIQQDDENLKEFYTNSIPNQLPLLCLQWGGEMLETGNYIDSLEIALPKITEEIALGFLIMDEKDF